MYANGPRRGPVGGRAPAAAGRRSGSRGSLPQTRGAAIQTSARGRCGVGMSDAGILDGLLTRVAQRDAEAFRRLYDLTCHRLMAVVLRMCENRATAEDVLQDVYVQIWRRAESFDPARGPAIAWMIVIARHRTIDHIRAHGRNAASGSAQDDLALEMLAAPADDPERSDTLRALLGCLRKLDAPRAEAVLLAYYKGLSRAELARRFDIPENTIKTWLRRGLIALRQCMGDRQG